MGDNAIEVLLVPVFREMSMNLEKLVKSERISPCSDSSLSSCTHSKNGEMK